MKMKMKILSILLVCIISFSFAVNEIDIKKETKEKIDTVVTILKNNSLTNDQKTTQIANLFDNFFDFERMSSLSLGKEQWNMLSKEQQKEFSDKFINKLKNSYAKKLSLYNDEEIVVEEANKQNNNRIMLQVYFAGKDGNKNDILFKFYDTKKDSSWLIYDVDILGVSIIQTYRSQFDGFLKRNSYEDLIKKIDTITIDDENTSISK